MARVRAKPTPKTPKVKPKVLVCLSGGLVSSTLVGRALWNNMEPIVLIVGRDPKNAPSNLSLMLEYYNNPQIIAEPANDLWRPPCDEKAAIMATAGAATVLAMKLGIAQVNMGLSEMSPFAQTGLYDILINYIGEFSSGNVELCLPYRDLDLADILEVGNSIGVPWERCEFCTYSGAGREMCCMDCLPCLQANCAFSMVDFPAPFALTEYEWPSVKDERKFHNKAVKAVQLESDHGPIPGFSSMFNLDGAAPRVRLKAWEHYMRLGRGGLPYNIKQIRNLAFKAIEREKKSEGKS